jgi:hypothetical protein
MKNSIQNIIPYIIFCFYVAFVLVLNNRIYFSLADAVMNDLEFDKEFIFINFGIFSAVFGWVAGLAMLNFKKITILFKIIILLMSSVGLLIMNWYSYIRIIPENIDDMLILYGFAFAFYITSIIIEIVILKRKSLE